MQPWSQFWLHGSNKNIGTCSNLLILSLLCIFAVQGFLDSLTSPACTGEVLFSVAEPSAYALPTLPNSSIFSFTVALMASKPGASSFLGS